MKRAIIGTYWTNLKDAENDAKKKCRERQVEMAIVSSREAYIVVSAKQLR